MASREEWLVFTPTLPPPQHMHTPVLLPAPSSAPNTLPPTLPLPARGPAQARARMAAESLLVRKGKASGVTASVVRLVAFFQKATSTTKRSFPHCIL